MQILGNDWQDLCKQLSGHRWVGNSKIGLSEPVFSLLFFLLFCHNLIKHVSIHSKQENGCGLSVYLSIHQRIHIDSQQDIAENTRLE